MVVILEFFAQVALGFAELAAVAFVENEDYLLAKDGEIALAFHQVVELLNGGDDDFVIGLFQVFSQLGGVIGAIGAFGGKALVLFHGLVVEVFAVDDKEHLINKIELSRQLRSFEAGKGFAGAGGVPDVATAFGSAPSLALVRAFDLAQDTLGGGYLVRAHDQQSIVDIEYRVVQQYAQEGILGEKGYGEIFEVFDEAIVRGRPVHGEIEAVFIALDGIGEIARIGAIANDEDLQVFVKRASAIEALFAVAVDLVKGFADGDAALFELDLHQGQAIDEDGDIVAVGVGAALLELLYYLELVAGNGVFIEQIDILNTAIVKDKIIDVVIVNFAGFIDDTIAGLIQITINKALPFGVIKLDIIERLQLHAGVGEHRCGGFKIGQKFIALADQVLNQLAL